MPATNTCTVCQRSDRAEVDAALASGEGLNATARRFGLTRSTLQSHAKHRNAKPATPSPPLRPEMDVVAPAVPASSPPPLAPEPAAAPPPPEEPPPPSEPPASAPANVIAFPGAGAGRSRVGKGRLCACCTSECRQEIDAAIGSGMSYRGIEQRLGVSKNSARHHATPCVPTLLAKAADARAAAEQQTVDTVLEEVTRLLTEARDGLAAAVADLEAPHRDRATWHRELRQSIELMARLKGELSAANVDVEQAYLRSKGYERLQRAILGAIKPEGASLHESVTCDQILPDIAAALRALDA